MSDKRISSSEQPATPGVSSSPLGDASGHVRSPWFSLSCAQAGCDAAATHVVVQASDMALLFRSGAGTMCEHHARDMESVGGCALALSAFVEAVNRAEAA